MGPACLSKQVCFSDHPQQRGDNRNGGGGGEAQLLPVCHPDCKLHMAIRAPAVAPPHPDPKPPASTQVVAGELLGGPYPY